MKKTTLQSAAIVAVVSFLLTANNAGLDTRPVNQTCLAEHITPRIVVTDAFPGNTFVRPMIMRQNAADNTRIFIAEKGGTVQVMVNGIKQSTPFLDISSQVSSGGEQGLLGMAFHPDYATNGFFFVSYTDSNGNSIISRFTRSVNNLNRAEPNSETVVLTLDQPYANHNGGNIDFGPDGFLYIGFGDGGSAGDPLNHAQDLSTWLGAILRLDINGTPPYAIPAANPFAAQTCNQAARTGICPETYAYGLRNPWRWSFDAATGDLWLGDVGQNQIEEVDRIERGANYGWRCFEGTEIYNSAGCDAISAVAPVVQYSHSSGRCSITGGYVYRGTAIPEFTGYYLYGDFCTGEIWGLPTAGLPDTLPVLLTTSIGNIYSFAEDRDGEIYVLQSSGVIGKIIMDRSGGNPDPVPDALSETGCTDASDTTQPAAGMIPYGINAPFWSDGSEKSRWLALPDTSRIVNTSQDWYFPPGTVLIKQFKVRGRLIETRHFKRHTNGVWAGYTYEWNDLETDAARIRQGKTKTINNGTTSQQWVFPSESECLVCHTAAAGHSLGPETTQLNMDFSYPSTGRTDNQLNTLSEIRLLENKLGDVPKNLPALANPYNIGEDLTLRARAWLHTNCAGCHRPGGSTNSSLDLRSDTKLSATNSCNVPANSSGTGWPTILLNPGNATTSLLHYRANSRDGITQMPPLASTLVDLEGTELLKDWINSLDNCTP
ncbi:MAG: PQQ-dependent sugar dehydrogenase [Desulfopila sp.]|jgi:uncharacterized repeat protein (TIGR03806 family)|nr:PQQ-dependent sugar dehydrogenase [Desulfopila sp.]